VEAGAVGTRGDPGATLSWEVGARAAGTRVSPEAALRWEVGARAAGTRGTSGAALHREVGAGATVTRGGPGAALSREVGAGATVTCGSSRAALRWEVALEPVMPSDNPHRMITWGKTGFRVVPDRLVLTVAISSPTPSLIPSAHAALAGPHWHAAMEDKYGALISNGIWKLVPRPQGSNVVTEKWVFTHKLRADGTLDRYKARWVLQGFTQCPRVDYDETFNPVVK
jgi:hypothetical protein